MEYSTPGFPVLHYIPEFAQIHVHWVGDAIQQYYPLSTPSAPAFSLSQHQGFSSELVLHIRWPKYWSFNEYSNEYSNIPMNIQGWFPLGLTGLISLLSKGLSSVFSSTTVRKHQFFSAQPSLLSSSHNYWKNQSFDYRNLCQQRCPCSFVCCLGLS